MVHTLVTLPDHCHAATQLSHIVASGLDCRRSGVWLRLLLVPGLGLVASQFSPLEQSLRSAAVLPQFRTVHVLVRIMMSSRTRAASA